jgi:hypothetical protein
MSPPLWLSMCNIILNDYLLWINNPQTNRQ